MAKIVHENIKGANPTVPGGTPSCTTQLTEAPLPKQTQCKPITPRQDPGSQDRFNRGATRSWQKSHPRATRSG